MNFSTIHKQRKLILLAAIVGIIAVFLPWITVSASMFGESISRSTNGFRGAGILVFLAFAGAIAVSLLGNQVTALNKSAWFGTLACGAAGLLGVVIFIINSSGNMGDFGIADAGFGFGLWIALLAAAGIAVVAWLLKSPGDTLQSGFDSLKNSVPAAQSNPPAINNDVAAAQDKISQLQKLVTLKDEGKITEAEYQDLKAKLLV